MRNITTIKALVIAFGLVCGPLSAQGAAALAIQIDPNGTSYLSGGIGDEELQQINQASRDFNLKIILTEQSGAYAAHVAVNIVNAKGNQVLELPAVGPILLVGLRSGVYRVSATYKGKKIQKQVNVGTAGQRKMIFAW